VTGDNNNNNNNNICYNSQLTYWNAVLKEFLHHSHQYSQQIHSQVGEGGLGASTAGGRHGVITFTARAWIQKYKTDR
jgi:hypothetical protein